MLFAICFSLDWSKILLCGNGRVATRQGKVREIVFFFFQGQRIVREFCELSGKFENIGKCQGIIREL